MSAIGWPDFRIAKVFGVDVVTLWRWRKQYPEFAAASQTNEAERVAAMHAAAFHRGVGYSYESEKIMVVNGEVIRVPVVEHCPPDPSVLKYYLNNRDRANWSEKTEVEQSGGVTIRVTGGLPDQEDEK